MIERRIIAGLIVSTEYLRRVAPFWSDELIEAPEMRRIARWCLNYFARYDRAPDDDIEEIYTAALRNERLPRAEAGLIEGVLTAVSDDYGRGDKFNAAYLYDETVQWLRDSDSVYRNEQVESLRERGQLAEAEARRQSAEQK